MKHSTKLNGIIIAVGSALISLYAQETSPKPAPVSTPGQIGTVYPAPESNLWLSPTQRAKFKPAIQAQYKVLSPARAATDAVASITIKDHNLLFANVAKQMKPFIYIGDSSPAQAAKVKAQFVKTVDELRAEADYFSEDPTYIRNAGELKVMAEKGERIVGGGPTDPLDARYCVAIRSATGKPVASGSLIHPRLVLTAKHIARTRPVGSIVVCNSTSDSNLQIYKVIKTVPEKVTQTEEDGLMLLLLEKEVPNAELAPLPNNVFTPNFPFDLAPESEHQLEIIGFGRSDSSASSAFGQKRYAYVPFADNKPDEYDFKPNSEFAAGKAGLNIDTCNGDSGGPAMYFDYNTSLNYLVAVTARSSKHNSNTVPNQACGNGGIYIRVDNKIAWLRETVEKEFGIKLQ